jgi:serine/threonine protein kinase
MRTDVQAELSTNIATDGDGLQAGAQLGRYQILKRLSVGGMAEIFLARSMGPPGFQKVVVLKRILPQLANRAQIVEMFLDEARIAATLQHQNIVQTYAIDTADGGYFLAMEYLHGEDLRSILVQALKQGRRIPFHQVIHILISLTDGLDYAHRKLDFDGAPLQIVHRDVTPSNVIVTYDGNVKLLDFGIARAANRSNSTQSGTLKGKIAYMSPEQCRGLPLDRRSDIYSVGVLLWELSLGRRLYRGLSEFDTMKAIVDQKVIAPREYDPNYNEKLQRIVLKAVEKDPERRYQWAKEMQQDLEALARERGLYLSSSTLKSYMEELFGEKIEAWREAQAQGKTLDQHLEMVIGYEGELEEGLGEERGSPSLVPTRHLTPLKKRKFLLPSLGAAACALFLGVGFLRRPAPPVIEARATPAPALVPSSNPTISMSALPHKEVATVESAGVQDQLTKPERDPKPVKQERSDSRHQHHPHHHHESASPRVVAKPPGRTEVIQDSIAQGVVGKGKLVIASSPWCNVTVDGVDSGQTPISLTLKAGPHKVLLTNPEFKIRREATIVLQSDQIVRKKFDFVF